MKRTTIVDVAKAAGVSHPVVSVVLGGKSNSSVRVSEATRQKVQRIARELNYTPSYVARGLRENRSFLIGSLLSEVNWMLAADLIRGLQEALRAEDYSLVVQITDSLEAEERECGQFLRRGFDGMLINSWVDQLSDVERTWLQDYPLPRIEILGNFLPDCSSIEVDFEADGRAATEHLLALGHRQIALMIHNRYADGARFPTATCFAAGYSQAMQQAGATPRICEFPLEGIAAWEQQCVAAGTQNYQTLFQCATPPTAVVCYNDYVAYGLLRAARRAGTSIPRELSIIGHFDVELSRLVDPALTSLEIPIRDLGRMAGEMLFATMRGSAVENRLLPSRLIMRESTGPRRC